MESILSDTRPKKSKAVRSSAAITAEIENVDMDLRKAYATVIATERELADLERKCIAGATVCRGSENNIEAIDNFRNEYALIGGDLSKAAACRYFLELLNRTPEVTEAMALLSPLHAERAEAVEREQIEAQKLGDAERELREAKDSALAELQGQLDQHPAVVEAQRKLEPYRRKGELVTQ